MRLSASPCIIPLLIVLLSGWTYGAPLPSPKPGEGAVLKVVGTGRLPAGRSGAQARLLARRAATVDAYRNLLKRLGEYSGRLEKGTGRISVDGYVKGAFVDEVRYYPGGKVEVVLGLNAKPKGGMRAVPGTVEAAVPEEAYEVERPGTVISIEEWQSFKVENR